MMIWIKEDILAKEMQIKMWRHCRMIFYKKAITKLNKIKLRKKIKLTYRKIKDHQI